MELYPTSTPENRQEIQCQDCGHAFYIARGQRSSRCGQCGNIAFYAENVLPLSDLARQTKSDSSPMDLLQARVLNRIQQSLPSKPVPAQDLPINPLAEFEKTPDGRRVQELIMKYQVEWQLWAMLVKNFSDPAYHMAYLTAALSSREIAQASTRYVGHRKAMMLSAEDGWQVDICELMLSRLQTLSLMPINLAQETWQEKVPAWMLSPLWESSLFRFSVLMASMIVFVQVFSKMFPHIW